MILAITPNPALDVTYTVDATRPHEVNRVREVRIEAGGKGVNVAKVLAQLGEPVRCAGPLGGPAGDELRRRLAATAGRPSTSDAADTNAADTTPADTDSAHAPAQAADPLLRQGWTWIDGTTRRTLAVVDSGGATGLYEPGPQLSAAEVQQLLADVGAVLTGAIPPIEAATISGSLPGGMSGEDLATLIAAIRDAGRPVLVDTSGPGLLTAARAGATVLKPNAEEAMEATGESTALDAARALCELGAGTVVCSLGGEGMLGLQPVEAVDRTAATTVRAWRARLPQALDGNPTGAGDSVVAALASTVLLGRTDLPTALRRAVAVGASAVTRPVAGEIDLELIDQLEPTVTIEEI
ncbi:1-phosphofructokinase family hexose kinase [Brachybacterium sp. p3-SID957]|uniref:1-phosphofructokinase family hexose kinase n=1 Tax=Brachybacterium sp. p3-SID957 TaxID=2916049 RepID=UPI00223B961D|nr:PfkB family carbohydrate kinase [Brachybacterium sp. p3-SID957]MCT1774712.1 PfkB family carbohydrate kinase [Brachybacterium sp. p3-SID957]